MAIPKIEQDLRAELARLRRLQAWAKPFAPLRHLIAMGAACCAPAVLVASSYFYINADVALGLSAGLLGPLSLLALAASIGGNRGST